MVSVRMLLQPLVAFQFLAVSVFPINISHLRRCIGWISGDLDTEDPPSAIAVSSGPIIHDKLGGGGNGRGTADGEIRTPRECTLTRGVVFLEQCLSVNMR